MYLKVGRILMGMHIEAGARVVTGGWPIVDVGKGVREPSNVIDYHSSLY